MKNNEIYINSKIIKANICYANFFKVAVIYILSCVVAFSSSKSSSFTTSTKFTSNTSTNNNSNSQLSISKKSQILQDLNSKLTKIKINKELALEKTSVAKTINPPDNINKNNILPAKVNMSYLKFISKNKHYDQIVNKLNLELNHVYKNMLTLSENASETSGVDVYSSIDSFIHDFAQNFENDYISSLTSVENQNDVGGWFIDITSSPVFVNSDFVSIEIKATVFIGGAHPITQIKLFTLDLKKLEVLQIESIIASEHYNSFLTLAESLFRKNQNILPNQDFLDAGFHFEGNKFSLPNNFYVDKKGITFLYNPYEIAPYSYGPIKIFIPWKEIKDFVIQTSNVSKFIS